MIKKLKIAMRLLLSPLTIKAPKVVQQAEYTHAFLKASASDLESFPFHISHRVETNTHM